MPDIPTQAEMSSELRQLATHMRAVSDRLLYVSGFDAETHGHSIELRCASRMVEQWAKAMKPRNVSKKKAGGK